MHIAFCITVKQKYHQYLQYFVYINALLMLWSNLR